jgi:adenosine deaminase
MFYKERFRVTLNTDDRLMSDTTMTKEFLTAIEVFGLNLDDLERITINSMKSAFIPYKERIKYIYDVIKPGYDKVRRQLLSLNTYL